MRDLAKLNTAGGVEFDDASADELLLFAEIWEYERHEVVPYEKARYSELKALSRRAQELGYDFRPHEIEWGPEEEFSVRMWDRTHLGILAEHIERIWRARGGKGVPGKNDKEGRWTGPVTELILELWEQLGIPKSRRRGRSTIRDAMLNFPRETPFGKRKKKAAD